jgi:glycosyltransferase involved in cell wall biosynthesis
VQWICPSRTLRQDVSPSAVESFVDEFRFLAAAVNPDIVHAGPIQTCGYIAALTGVRPLLITSWGSDLLLFAYRNDEWNAATRFTLQAADGFLCDSHAVRNAALRFAAIPESRIAQFPWGLEHNQVVKPHVRENATREHRVRFLCTRSWEPNYCIDVLLDAFGLLYAKDACQELILVGGGSLSSRVEQIISAHKLENVVITPGIVPASEMTKWFGLADVYVSCAQADGTSISMLEAMAAGLPVVLTDIPSNREWVVEGENGWLAAAGSPRDFADKMLCAASLGPAERHALAARNREIVAKRADWDRNFPALMVLYQTLKATSRSV